MCTGKACRKRGADDLLEAAHAAAIAAGHAAHATGCTLPELRVRSTSCLDYCKKGPAVEVRVGVGGKHSKVMTHVSPTSIAVVVAAALGSEEVP